MRYFSVTKVRLPWKLSHHETVFHGAKSNNQLLRDYKFTVCLATNTGLKCDPVLHGMLASKTIS